MTRQTPPEKMTKPELARLVAGHPGHIHPPLAKVRKWTKDELVDTYRRYYGDQSS